MKRAEWIHLASTNLVRDVPIHDWEMKIDLLIRRADQLHAMVPFDDRKPVEVKERDVPSIVREIFDEWLFHYKRKHPSGLRPALSKERSDLIMERLKDGHSADDLRLACKGIWYDRWSLGGNDRGKEYTDIKYAMRSAAHVEKFAKMAVEAAEAAGKPLPSNQPNGIFGPEGDVLFDGFECVK